MSTTINAFRTLVAGALCLGTIALGAGSNMIGRQSHNEGLSAVKAPSKVTIDAKLEEWDLSGQIWTFADVSVRERFSVKSAAMWDKDHLYLAYIWKDPMPLNSMVDPDFNPDKGWVADSLQLRVLAGGQTSWITTWFFSGKNAPVFHVAYWKDERNNKKGLDQILLVGKENGTDLGQGVEMAYKKLSDSTGFVQEVKIPWSIIYKKDHTARADESIKMGMEFLWGDPTGKTWPIHRYADNLAEGHTSREFFWTAKKAWGPITLLNKNNIETRKYIAGDSKPVGTIKVRARIPQRAANFSLVIEDRTGKRIRNLVGGVSAEDFTLKTGGGTRTVEVDWDGLDDQGKMVAPGSYAVRGLTHKGLGAEYEMTFYNPGTPAWKTTDGSGAWGADHAAPEYISRAGDWMIIAWGFAEGGHGIIGIGPDGKKKWGEKRGVSALASDKDYLYAIPNTWHTKEQTLMRLRVKDGAYSPFTLNGKERAFELPFAEILGEGTMAKVLAVTAAPGRIALTLESGQIALLNAESAELEKLLPVTKQASLLKAQPSEAKGKGHGGAKKAVSLAFSKDGKQLYSLVEGMLVSVDISSGKEKELTLKGMGKAVALNVDNDGNLLVVDMGPDQQVKAYAAAGRPLYTCGKKGGRPIRGKFIPAAMSHVSAVAADSVGAVWTTENWNFPRRVSVWSKDGALIRDYVGNTGYSGTGCYLHDDNPELGYLGPIEFRLDRKNRTWRVENILWVPDKAEGESFDMDGGHAQCQRFTATVNGKEHEYMFMPAFRDYHGYVIFMNRNGKWQPVSAITTAGTVSGEFAHHGQVTRKPDGELAGLNNYDAVIWNDTNGDGKLQRAECEVFKAARPGTDKRRGEIAIPMGSGWGERISKDFVFYTTGTKGRSVTGIHAYTPDHFTDDGAPVYSGNSFKKVAEIDTSSGDTVPVDKDNMLYLSWAGKSLYGVDTATGEPRWSYPNPYPGVHGSHKATMPKPGLLIGPLKITGVVPDCGDAKGVLHMRGNLGQDFFVTTDGLYVASMFQDGRLPGMVLPGKEESLLGMPMEMFSQGGEPFNGWFGKQDDGVVRMTSAPRHPSRLTSRFWITRIRPIRPAPWLRQRPRK
jgi:hypothetical protein